MIVGLVISILQPVILQNIIIVLIGDYSLSSIPAPYSHVRARVRKVGATLRWVTTRGQGPKKFIGLRMIVGLVISIQHPVILQNIIIVLIGDYSLSSIPALYSHVCARARKVGDDS